MKPKNAPKSRKMHCLVGFFAAKTKQNRASPENFGFAPKNFYRKIRCLSPKFFGTRCYTNFLRKIAVFHGRTVLCDPELVQAARIRREKPKYSLVYGVKQAVSLQKKRAKNCVGSLRRSKKTAAIAGGSNLFCHRAAEFSMAVFASGDRIFLCKRPKIRSNCLIFVGKRASCIAALQRGAEEVTVEPETFSSFC